MEQLDQTVIDAARARFIRVREACRAWYQAHPDQPFSAIDPALRQELEQAEQALVRAIQAPEEE